MLTMRLFLYFCVFLFSSCTLPPFLSGGKGGKKPPLGEEKPIATVPCQVDEDCILVPADCCGCSNGGKSIAVHKSQEESHNSVLQSQCSHHHMCKTVYLCGSIQVRCENSECVAVSSY